MIGAMLMAVLVGSLGVTAFFTGATSSSTSWCSGGL
jgi:hypothetical protein